MGYFANGSEGECYKISYCFDCINWRDRKDEKGVGCPIWDLHIFNSYDLANSKSKAKQMLDFLIPPDEFHNGKCSMFIKSRKKNQTTKRRR